MKVYFLRNQVIKQIIAFCAFVFLILSELFLQLHIRVEREGHLLILIYAVVIYSFIICSLYNSSQKIDLAVCFFCLSFFFQFGRHILLFFNIYDTNEAFSTGISYESLIKAGYWNLYAIISIYIGYLFVNQSEKHLPEYLNEKVREKEFLFSVKLLLLISLPFYVYNQFLAIKTTLEMGYGYRIIESSNTNSIVGLVSSFCIPSCIGFLIFASKKIYPLIILVFCYALQLFSGSRLSLFCSAIVLLSYYMVDGSGSRQFRKRMRKVLLIIVLVSFVFSIISNDRDILYKIFSGDIGLDTLLENNLIIEILGEMGFTFNTSAIVIQECPISEKHILGYSYLYSIIYILPNFLTGKIFPNIGFVDETFAPYITSYGGIGSSYSAEAYYNYGYLGIVPLILIGVCWAKLNKMFCWSIKYKQKEHIFLTVQIAQAMIFMVRSDMVYRFRTLVWYVLPVVLISYFRIFDKKFNFVIRK